MSKYFKKIGENLFCQDFIMEGALRHSRNYEFLEKLNQEFDFKKLWRDNLLKTYKGGAEIGPPPYPPEVMLKMLFLSFLFKVKEREIERMINDSLSMKAFLGLSFDEPAPDHSSITKFRDRILEYEKYKEQNIFTEIFDEIVVSAQEKGVDLGFTQAIDSTHTIADVNTRKEEKRRKKKSDGGEGKPPRDPDARWGVKRTKKVTTTDKKKVKINVSYYGYKSHLSVNTAANLITSFRVTPFNSYDGHSFQPLMSDDIVKGVAKKHKTTYTADKAYDDGENHVWLNQARLFDAIDLKYAKKNKKTESGKLKAKWTQFTTQEQFEAGLNQRFAVERVNACIKKYNGLDRARYLGLAKMKTQTAMTAITHNLKTLVKQLTGVGLRTYTTAHVS